MEKQFNFTESLAEVGTKSLEKSKRLQNQANEYLQKYYQGLRESEALVEEAAKEALIGGAAFSQNSAFMRNKQRTQLAEQAIRYNNRASTIVMTDILSNIVEESLLMETDEYAEMNPAYKVEIRETVLAFLENANLNKSIKDERTLTIMEHVARNIPDVKTGVYLKEEEIVDIVKKATPKEVNNSIDNLVGDVKERVANIVSDEQQEEEKLQDEIDEIVAISEAAKAAKKAKAAKLDDTVEANAIATAEKEGVDPAKVLPPAEELPIDGEEEYIEDEMPVDVTPEEASISDETIEAGMPISIDGGKETKIKVNPDGGVELNIKEAFVRERPRRGVLETFAFNEGMEMVEEGKEYNGNLAIANAVMYITILETFNATGLMNISPVEYKKLADR